MPDGRLCVVSTISPSGSTVSPARRAISMPPKSPTTTLPPDVDEVKSGKYAFSTSWRPRTISLAAIVLSRVTVEAW